MNMNKETGKKKMTILDYINDRIEYAKEIIDCEKDHINQEISEMNPDTEIIRTSAVAIECMGERVFELDQLWKEICSGSLDLDVNLD